MCLFNHDNYLSCYLCAFKPEKKYAFSFKVGILPKSMLELSQCLLVLYHISFYFCSMILLNMTWICFNLYFLFTQVRFSF